MTNLKLAASLRLDRFAVSPNRVLCVSCKGWLSPSVSRDGARTCIPYLLTCCFHSALA